jgi:hypothetical protein
MSSSADIDFSDPVAHAKHLGLHPDPVVAEYVEHHVRNILTVMLYGDAVARKRMREKLQAMIGVLRGDVR